MDIWELADLAGKLTGLIAFVSGGILWYKGSVEKRYAAERAFEHLRKNQEQMSQSLSMILEEIENVARDTAQVRDGVRDIDRNLDDLNRTGVEQKAFVAGMSNRLEGIAARLFDGMSGGWMRQNQG